MQIGDERTSGRHPDEADLAAALGLEQRPPTSPRGAPRSQVRAHLAGCATCQRRARALRVARAGLTLLAEHDQDELSARRLEQRILTAWAADSAGAPHGAPSLPAPRPFDLAPSGPPSAAAPGRSWRRRVTAWAAAAVLVAAGTAAAAVALDRALGPRAQPPSARPAKVADGASSVAGPSAAPARSDQPEPRARRAFPGVDPRTGEGAPADHADGPPDRSRAAAMPSGRSVTFGDRSVDPTGGPDLRGGRAPAPREAAERSSSTGETSVSVISGPPPYLRALRAAEQAFHVRHDLDAALGHARRARELAAGRTQARRAERLACDALIALGRAEDAVVACARLLDDPNPEQVRMTHYALGSLLRGRLGDCERARPHFDAAVVFGHSSLYATDARLQRARCALEQRDLDQVERDLAILRARTGLRDLGREIDQLEVDLSRARAATSAKDRRGPAR